MSTPLRIPPLSILLATLAVSCQGEDTSGARVTRIERLDQAIGGVKALGRPGDYLLENDKVRAVVVGPRNSMGPGIFGGGLIDADLRRWEPDSLGGRGNDLLAEIAPTANLNIMAPTESGFEVLSDGSDGGEARLRVSAPAEPYFTVLDALWGLVNAPELWLVTDYAIRPGEGWIRMNTAVLYGYDGSTPLPESFEPIGNAAESMPIIQWAVESGVVLGDFYLQGGSIDAFAPGVGFDEDGLVFEAREAGQNLFLEPFRFPFLAGTGDGVSYGIAAVDGEVFVPLFTAGQTAVIGGGRQGDGTNERFADGTALSYERYFFIGHGDIGSIVDQYVIAKGVPHGRVAGHVLEEGLARPLTDIQVFARRVGDPGPWNEWKTDVHPEDRLEDGSFGGALPVGEWELFTHRHGRPDSAPVRVTVTEGETVEVNLVAPRPGLFSFTVADGEGMLLPSKVTLFRADGEGVARNPVLGDPYIGGQPEMVLFSLNGRGEAELPAGTYRAVASRGLEYELGVSEPFVIDATRRHHVDLVVERSIDTQGWVSADLHVHAAPSHDSGVLLVDRARTMAAEGVEFFASTDHDYISDYGPVIERLGLEPWVQSAVGVETTTLEIGHFLAFPMQADFLGDAGGAMDWTNMLPAEIIGTLKEQGQDAGYSPLVFVGHPRSGILGYFDQYGLNPYRGVPGLGGGRGEPVLQTPTLALTNPLLAASNISWEFDGLEILNGKRFDYLRTPTAVELATYGADPEGELGIYQFMERTLEEQAELADGTYTLAYGPHGGVDDWFTLLNLGFRYTILGNSDTHGWTETESGCPRNYVMSSTDDPAALDDQEIADAVKAHRVVASYGPFMQMWANGQPIGSEISANGGPVTLSIEVQAPTWMQVDRVELYENGTLIREWALEPDQGPVRFMEELELSPAVDSWYVAVAMGDGDLGPVFTRVEIPYIELQEIVTEALSGVPAVSTLLSPAPVVPRKYQVYPYAITNPIWVDLAGDGWQAPGRPAWLDEPEPPPAEE